MTLNTLTFLIFSVVFLYLAIIFPHERGFGIAIRILFTTLGLLFGYAFVLAFWHIPEIDFVRTATRVIGNISAIFVAITATGEVVRRRRYEHLG